MYTVHSQRRTFVAFVRRFFLLMILITIAWVGMLFMNGPAQASNSFDSGYQQAQQNGQSTGMWGSAPYYIDTNHTMHVGNGALQGSFYQAAGTHNANTIQSIDFVDSVKAPANSSFLFSGTGVGQNNLSLTSIEGAEKIDMTSVTSMSNMFSNDQALRYVDFSTWYTPNLQDVSFAFLGDSSLVDADLAGWNTSQVTNAASLFSGDSSLQDVNVADWDTHDFTDMSYMFDNDSSIEDLNLTNWQTTNARNMSYLFNGDTSLKRLAIYNFDTMDLSKNVTGMFNEDLGIFFISLGNNFRVRNEENLALDVVGNTQTVYNDSLQPYLDDWEDDLEVSGVYPGTWYSTSNSASFSTGATYPNEDVGRWSVVGDNQAQSMPYYSTIDLPAYYNVDKNGNMNVGNGSLKGMNLQQLFRNNQGIVKSIHINAPAKVVDDSSHSNENEGAESDNWSSETNPGLFANAPNATLMDLRQIDSSSLDDYNQMFANDTNLNSLNISTWNTTGKSQQDMFADDNNMTDLYLGDQTQLKPESHLPDGTWHNYDTGETLSSAQLTDGNSHPGHWRQPQFMKYFYDAQHMGWRTGYWGTAPYYIDDDNQMHVGSGNLDVPLYDVIGDASKTINDLSFDGRAVAPQGSAFLLSTSHMAGDSSSLDHIDNLDHLDTSQAQDMSSFFANDTGLSIANLSGLNTHNATNMAFMFFDDWSLVSVNGEGLDTSNVQNFEAMFYNDYRLKDPDIGSWDVHDVTDMKTMFWGDGDIYHLGINDWHPDSLETMDSMFMNDMSLSSLDLSHWNPLNMYDMHSAFVNNKSIKYMDLSGWQLPHVQDMESAFNGDSNMDHLDLGRANTSNADDMHFLTDGAHDMDMLTLGPHTQLKDIGYLPGVEWQSDGRILSNSQLTNGSNHPGFWQQTQFSHDFQYAQAHGQRIGYWGDAPYYIDDSHHMHVGTGQLRGSLYDTIGRDAAGSLQTLAFDGRPQAPQDSISLLSTSDVAGSESSLAHIYGLDKLDTSQTTNMASMFANDTRLDDVNASSFNTHQVTNMSYMFANDHSMSDLNVNDMDTSQVTTLQSIFFGVNDLKDLNVSDWDVHNVQNMDFSFIGMESLTDLKIAGWNPSSVQSLSGTFDDDKSLNDLDLSGWRTPNLSSLQSTFAGDTSLDNLALNNWDTTHVGNATSAFDRDDSLDQLTLGPATRLNKSTYFVGVEWQRTGSGPILHNSQIRDGQSHPGTWQQTQFSHGFQKGLDSDWHTGYWGDAPFYVDDQANLHVGTGHLLSNLDNNIGDVDAQRIRTINMEEPVVAPANSSFLFSPSNLGRTNDNVLTHINGLDKVDMSSADDIDDIFTSDYHLNDLDLSSWNTSNVERMQFAFYGDTSLTDLNVSDWDTHHVNNMYSIFSGTTNLSNLNVKDWDTRQVYKFQAAFYNNPSLTNLDLSGWQTDHPIDMTDMFTRDDNLSLLSLGAHTSLSSNAGLRKGLWQDYNDNQNQEEMMDSQAHPGEWQYVPTQDDNRGLFGTDYDRLLDLIERQYHLGDDSQNVQIMRDGHSQDSNGYLRPGDYPDIYYTINDDGARAYHTSLHVSAYTRGDDLAGKTSQSVSDVMKEHYGGSVTIDDDGGSSNGNGAMNYGDYQVRYHYQDGSGTTEYRISQLHVFGDTQAKAPYLIVNDHPSEELSNVPDLQRHLVQFLGIDNDSSLSLSNVSNDTVGYDITDGDHSYTGMVQVIPTFRDDMTMYDVPGASNGAFWNNTAMNVFNNDTNGIRFDHSTINNYRANDQDGSTHVQGNLYPVVGQFANDPTIPYELDTHSTTKDYSIDNTVNDAQVQDVINSMGAHPQVIAVTDGQGVDVTGSFGELSTIPQDSNVIVKVKTDAGYANITFAHISSLVEPNVDVTYNPTSDSSDISNDDLRNQIMGQTHESSWNDFTVDDSQMVSSNVKEIGYHFNQDVNAQGKGVNVRTNGTRVTGTAYVHYQNDDTNDTPTYTVTQGSNPVQHITDMTGQSIQIMQAPMDLDNSNVPVGDYEMTYRYIGDASSTTYHATLNVTPNYYFSPVTLDNSSGMTGFHSYDYQLSGNYYMSTTYVSDNSNDNQHDDSGKDYVDGLHTQDGRLAHFDGKYGNH